VPGAQAAADATAANAQTTTAPAQQPSTASIQKAGTAKQSAQSPVSRAAKPVAAAAQAPAQSSGASAPSPSQSQPSQTGTGAHTGGGSDGHPATAGQTGIAGTAAADTSSGSQPTNAFSVEAAGSPGSSGQAQPTSAATDSVARTSVSLQEAVDAVRATFTAANQAGISSARISLSPASLGGIKISLSQTPDGLVARVVTDHPDAAQTLQQNAGDLKRSLEASGMSLLRLDIGSSGQQNLGSFSGSKGDGSSAGAQVSGEQSDGGEEDAASTNSTELTIELSSGSLVNVLA
jgi:flagellar hook-length control protein FliK